MFFADADRELAGNLIVELKKESLVTSAQFLEGFRELVMHMAEKDQEIPRIYSHVAGDHFDCIIASLPLQTLRLF